MCVIWCVLLFVYKHAHTIYSVYIKDREYICISKRVLDWKWFCHLLLPVMYNNNSAIPNLRKKHITHVHHNICVYFHGWIYLILGILNLLALVGGIAQVNYPVSADK